MEKTKNNIPGWILNVLANPEKINDEGFDGEWKKSDGSKIEPGLHECLQIARKVFEQYEKDQPKMYRKLNHTPILNDISVRMAKAFLKEISP